jgi:hypothetical protein
MYVQSLSVQHVTMRLTNTRIYTAQRSEKNILSKATRSLDFHSNILPACLRSAPLCSQHTGCYVNSAFPGHLPQTTDRSEKFTEPTLRWRVLSVGDVGACRHGNSAKRTTARRDEVGWDERGAGWAGPRDVGAAGDGFPVPSNRPVYWRLPWTLQPSYDAVMFYEKKRSMEQTYFPSQFFQIWWLQHRI